MKKRATTIVENIKKRGSEFIATIRPTEIEGGVVSEAIIPSHPSEIDLRIGDTIIIEKENGKIVVKEVLSALRTGKEIKFEPEYKRREQVSIKEKFKILRGKTFEFIVGYWWIWLILILIGYFLTNLSVFRYIVYIVGIPLVLLFLSPFIIQLFSPVFGLIYFLIEHFKEAKDMPFGKKYIFIPMAIVSSASFVAAQMILSTWVFVLSFLSWMSVIGFFFTFLLIFLFGLEPLLIFTTPFIVWYKLGFVEFLDVGAFFLLALFWYEFSKLAFSENYYESTPEDFIGYSPQIFLLGALSLQVVAMPLYALGLNIGTKTPTIIGNWISLVGGGLLLFLAIISAIIWWKEKKKLPLEQKEDLYKPSVWIYIFGLLVTGLLYNNFIYTYGVPATILYWLNGFFLIVLIMRFVGFIKRKIHPFKGDTRNMIGEQVKYKNILTIISVAMLFLAIPSLFPYGYYQFLRWVVTGTAIFILYLSHKLGKKMWLWLMAAIAILFNPILPIYFDKETWVVIDLVVALLFLVSIFKIKPKE